jgi:epoxyqueuosine reductase QueG
MGPEVDLKALNQAMGGDFFGIARLECAHEAILAQGGSNVADLPVAVSVGVALHNPVVDQLPQRAHRAVAMTYRHHAYDVVNQRLDHITSRLSSVLQQKGHRALPVPASQTVDDERLCGIFSHKMAAHLAGLGWIGKSCLLVTREVGPRVRWGTVLTDAPMPATGEPLADGCGTCRDCVDVCPPQAFTGRPFHPSEPREVRYVAQKCDRYFDAMRENGKPAVCGLCLYVCPFGKNRGSGRVEN